MNLRNTARPCLLFLLLIVVFTPMGINLGLHAHWASISPLSHLRPCFLKKIFLKTISKLLTIPNNNVNAMDVIVTLYYLENNDKNLEHVQCNFSFPEYFSSVVGQIHTSGTPGSRTHGQKGPKV